MSELSTDLSVSMIQFGKELKNLEMSSRSAIRTSFSSMDLKASSFLSAKGRHSLDNGSTSLYSKNKGNPFADSFPDPLCKLNLKETSDFVKALPMSTKCSSQRREGMTLMGQRRLQETPSTPERPLFSFSPGYLQRKSIPTKWDDAEKWLIGSPCCDYKSPAHVTKPTDSTRGLGKDNFVLPLDKFTNNVGAAYPNLKHPEPSKECLSLKHSPLGIKKDLSTAGILEIKYRDVGTDTTPLGSSMTTRCHTPNKSSSPARHNTPADRSGTLDPCSSTSISISELNDRHLAKLNLSAQYDSIFPNWSTREEEEEEVSKSLRHLDIKSGRKSTGLPSAAAWEEEERIKSCIRYQREEAKIQAWLNLQNAKAEAESRKLEVKIQKMRSNLEEKLMKRMADANRRAEEWRAAAEQQHSQPLKRASGQAQRMKSRQSSSGSSINPSCGCFPCKNQP